VQAGGGLVEDVERVAALGALELGGELDALRLAARELGGGLAEAQVAEAHLRSTSSERRTRRRRRRTPRRVDGHREHVGDRLAAQAAPRACRRCSGRRGRPGRGRRRSAGRGARRTRSPRPRSRAAPLGDVEREAPGVVAPRAPLRGGEALAHVVEEARVGGEVRARRAADRPLVDAHQPLHSSRPPAIRPPGSTGRARGRPPRLVLGLLLLGLVAERLGHELDQRLAHEARLPRARDAGDGREGPEREGRRRAAEVVARHPASAASPGARAAGAPRRRRAEEVRRVLRASTREARGRAAVEHLAAVLARAGPTSTIQSARRTTSSSCSTTKSELPAALELSRAREQRLGVGRVQAGGGLVEHVDHAEEVRAHLRREPQPLELARRERRRAPLQGEVAEPEVEQHVEPGAEVLGDAPRHLALLGVRRRASARRPSAYGAKIAHRASGQAATARRCRARRRSPRAPRACSRLPPHSGQSLLTMYCATRASSARSASWRRCAARSAARP
jgi:hypothetical protein